MEIVDPLRSTARSMYNRVDAIFKATDALEELSVKPTQEQVEPINKLFKAVDVSTAVSDKSFENSFEKLKLLMSDN